MQPIVLLNIKGNRVSDSAARSGARSTALAFDEKATKEEDRQSNGGGQPRRTTKEKEPKAENSTF